MNEMNEINHFDEYWQAPIACFIVFLGALWVFRSPVRKLILIVVDLFTDHSMPVVTGERLQDPPRLLMKILKAR
jgi:hypothetical protein